jgi:hypothetical protein
LGGIDFQNSSANKAELDAYIEGTYGSRATLDRKTGEVTKDGEVVATLDNEEMRTAIATQMTMEKGSDLVAMSKEVVSIIGEKMFE